MRTCMRYVRVHKAHQRTHYFCICAEPFLDVLELVHTKVPLHTNFLKLHKLHFFNYVLWILYGQDICSRLLMNESMSDAHVEAKCQ
jgi:hypothetical protein